MLLNSRRRGSRAVAALAAGALMATTFAGAPAAAVGAAEVGVNKTVSRTTVQPGQELFYDIVGTCSSLTTPCVDFTLTDTIPAQFEVTSLPQSNSQRTVTFDQATRLLTVKYVIPVAGGAIPPGSVGLPAGSVQSIQIGLRLPTQTDVLTGKVITNTADVTAKDADPASSSVDVTTDIPVAPRPVATKKVAPDTHVATSGGLSVITLGIRNASSTSTVVKELLVADTSADTFNNNDLTAVGPIVSFPPGTDQVVVETCTKPVGTACAEADWVPSTAQTGPTLTAPAGVNLADVTGIRYRFSNSGAADIPYSATEGAVKTTVKLRDLDRTTNAPIEPITKQTVVNCATPSLGDGAGQIIDGKDACKDMFILPNSLVAKTTKSIFSDSDGNYGQDGTMVVGQNSGVSMKITAQNTSSIPAGALSITEPAPGAEFDKIDVTKGRIVWPSGATSAELSVTCRSGSQPSTLTLAKSSGTQALPGFGCDPGVFPSKISVKFLSPSGGNPPAIPPNATGHLDLHGTASGVTMDDVTDGLRNCADGDVSIPGGASSSVARSCADAVVAAPLSGIGNRVKHSFGVATIVPGQPMPMRISFSNTGNIPTSNYVVEDPPQSRIGQASNPFNHTTLDSMDLPASPAADFYLWDPNVPGYVLVPDPNAIDPALKARAKGFKVVVTGALDPGDVYPITFKLLLKDPPPPPGTKFTNCAGMGIGTADTVRCAPETTVLISGDYGASLNKRITPGAVVRPRPGVPAQDVTVANAIRNSGTFNLSLLQIVDKDPAFFDAFTFSTNTLHVNFPMGADRVKIDVCTSVANCAGDVWVNGTQQTSTKPTTPTGVSPATIKGIRVTFTNSKGDPLLPEPKQPTSTACPDASVCFTAKPKQSLESNGSPLPDVVPNASTGTAEQPDGTPLEPLSANADVNLTNGTPKLGFNKTPDSRIGPGEQAPFSLVAENTGTGDASGLVIVDPLPAELTFDPASAGAPGGVPYTITYTLPAGYPEPTNVVFETIRGGDAGAPAGCTDINRICTVRWSFPGYDLPPGGKVTVEFSVQLTPGTQAGQTITNTAGAAAGDGTAPNNVGCSTTGSAVNQPEFGTGTFCTDSATVSSLAGNDFQGQKWIKGDPNLGWLDSSGLQVPVGDPNCPVYVHQGESYTRYPCVVRVLPGAQIDYLIRGVNSGTSPVKEIILVDGLPVQGDNGVLLERQNRGTEWPDRPTMSTPVTNVENYPGVTTEYTDAAYMTPSFCRNAIKPPGQDTCPAGSFGATFGPSNTGFQTKIVFDDANLLTPGKSIMFSWQMTAPTGMASVTDEPIAWNSFAARLTFKNPDGSLRTLPAAEPRKVGVSMPMKQFSVFKEVTGLPPGVTLAPFAMAYSCLVGTTEVARGTFTVEAGQAWISPKVPGGSTCSVWETDSQGGVSSNLGEANAAMILVDNPDATATITNDYDAGQLTVKKTVVWDAVPPIPLPPAAFEVNCSFPTAANTLPGFPMTFTLADGQDKVITDIPTGAQCEVTETNTEGATYTTITPSNAPAVEDTTATVVADSASAGGTTAEVVNTYQTGGIEITKVLDGASSQWAQGPFTVDVACTETGLPDLTFKVTLSPRNLSETIRPIPAGYTCAITESDKGDASSAVLSPSSVLIPPYVLTPPGPVQVKVTNTFDAAQIEVTKKVSGPAAAQMAGATYEIRVQCERDLAGGAGTQTFLDETVQLKAGETVAVPGQIPMKARCWATETNSVGATTVLNPQGSANKVTVSAAGLLTWQVENVYQEGGDADGSIKVSKTVTGAAASYAGDFEFLAACTVGATGGTGGFAIPDKKITIAPGGTLVGYFTGLPVGAECAVSETKNGGASSTVPVSLGTVTVPAQGAAAVEVTATNDFPAGSVTVEKILDGDASARMKDAEFTIAVTCEWDNPNTPADDTTVILTKSLTLKGGDSTKVADPLPMGAKCWIDETNTVGATTVTLSNDAANKATVTSGSPDLTLTAKNTYTPGGTNFTNGGGDIGGIKITKQLTGAAASFAQGPFVFETTCEIGGFTMPPITTTLTPTNLVGYVSNVVAGAVCTVVETQQGSADGTVPNTVGSVTIPANGVQAVDVSATNVFPSGSVKVAKELIGSGSNLMKDAVFTIQLTCERDLLAGGTEEIVSETIKLKGGEDYTYANPLPLGARCWIEETDSVGAGKVTLTNDSSNKAEITKAAPDLSLKATNEYKRGGSTEEGGIIDPTRSGIKVAKTLTGSAKAYAKGPFVFEAACSIGGFDLPVQTLTLDTDRLVGYISDLPEGALCTVTETDNGSAPGPVPVAVGSVTVPVFGDPAVEANAVNDFPGADLTVTKKVKGPGKGPFLFNVTCASDGTTDAGKDLDTSFSLAAGASKTITVPVGYECVVTETDAKGADSTDFSPGSTVAMSKPTSVTVTNTFDTPGLPTTGSSGMLGLAGVGGLLVLAGAILAGGVATGRARRRRSAQE